MTQLTLFSGGVAKVRCRLCGQLANVCTDNPANCICPLHGLMRIAGPEKPAEPSKVDDQPRDTDGRYSHELEVTFQCGMMD